MRYGVIVFDFDGTLADTRASIVPALQAVFEESGYAAPPRERILPLVGRPLPTVLRDLGGRPGDLERLRQRYLALFEGVADRSRFFAGIDDLLAALASGGARLAIATNRGLDSLERLLAAFGARDRFECLVSSSCVERQKPDPAMLRRIEARCGVAARDMVMVGDTTLDVETGRSAGAATCAVTYGAHSRAELERLEPDHLADSVEDLRRVLLTG